MMRHAEEGKRVGRESSFFAAPLLTAPFRPPFRSAAPVLGSSPPPSRAVAAPSPGNRRGSRGPRGSFATEIRDRGLARHGPKADGGLDSAANDSSGVRGTERVGDLHSELEQFVERHRLTADPPPQRLSCQAFHRPEKGPSNPATANSGQTLA